MQIGDRYGRLTIVSLDETKATCHCSCGDTVSVLRSSLSSGDIRSCGCQRQKLSYKPGDKFCMLTVISIEAGGMVRCRCDCGNEKTVSSKHLTQGNVISCGCLKRKKQANCKPGDRFGMLTVLSEQDDGKVLCRCDCGNEVSVLRYSLLSGATKSCGCQRKKHSISPGDRFSMLTVLTEQDDGKVLCRCDCGNTVSVLRSNLTSGNTKSCGCLNRKFKDKCKPDDRFGMLTVLSEQDDGKILCRCDCGNTVSVFRHNLL